MTESENNQTEKFCEVKVPESLLAEVLDLVESKGYEIPLYQSRVAAGFPSPADDYLEGKLDLNKYLIKNPAATFFVRATGQSMTGVGIFPEDILLVDRSLKPKSGSIVIAVVDGELAVKRLVVDSESVRLCSENPRYKPLVISEGMELDVWGVVCFVIHSLR